MGNAAEIQFDMIPSFMGAPIGDLEDLVPDQVAIAGYFCDNLDAPAAGQRYLARQLRYASQSEKTLSNTIDLGDLNVFPLDPSKHYSAVISQCQTVLETGARLVLVGGDSSGLKALTIATGKILSANVSVISILGSNTDNLPKTQPIILSVDLKELAGIWMSQPHRLSGLSPAQMIAQIDSTPGNVVAAAIFGLFPALDGRGSTETRAALAILQAVAERLEKGVC